MGDRRDGAKIPISIVRHKDVEPSAAAPRCCSTATAPTRSATTRSSASRGCRCSTAAWSSSWRTSAAAARWGAPGTSRASCCDKKNTFTDYIDVRPAPGRHRLDDDADTLVGLGGSAGGLLDGRGRQPGSRPVRRPRRQVPFVDALTTILDPSLPLTVIEWDEWGDPLHDPEVYAYMKSYTPYENVAARDYPAMYVPHLDQRHPGVLRRAGQVGGPAARHAAGLVPRSCSSARCRPATVARADGTTPGASRPSSTPGSSTRPAHTAADEQPI